MVKNRIVGNGKTWPEKKGKKRTGRVCGESNRNGRAAKKERRLTKCNHADLFGVLFIRAEDGILTGLAHPGNQELFLRKLCIESFDFPAAGHADILLHPGDPIREEQVSGSWLDAGRVRDMEPVAHAATFLARFWCLVQNQMHCASIHSSFFL
jgi:hypothetical protein